MAAPADPDLSLAGAAAAIAADVLYREARALDARDWAGWLALYAEDAVYWVPAWRDEDTQTADPDRELSLIFHDSRRGLAERVARVTSGKSVTAMPLPRTTHFVTNVAAALGADALTAEAAFQVRVYQPRTERTHVHFGRYEVRLTRAPEGWRIAGKTIRLQNDLLPALIDFYTL
jgi:3-phenylpropionate/cinnamic acid dioxygenase small subunit